MNGAGQAPQVSLDLQECFNDLLLSSAFDPRSAPNMTKWHILTRFWEKEVPYLQSRFGPDGRKIDEPDFSGFGFVVEGLARYSLKLPRNTERGDIVSQLIMSVLHEGKSEFISLGERRANSDFIWLENVGQRVTVKGIGEVKASLEAFKQKRWQLGRQESALRKLAKDLELGRANQAFLSKRKLVIPDEIERILIVPFGEASKFGNDLIPGWKILELEFSHREMTFIAKRIWSKFRPNIQFGPGQLTEFEKILLGFMEIMKPKLDELFVELVDHIPHRQLGLFILATEKLPDSEKDMEWIESLVEACFWPTIQNCFDNPLRRDNLSQKEREYFERFLYSLTCGTAIDQESLLFFISFIRYLAVEIINQSRKQHNIRYLNSLQSFNPIEII